MRVRMRSLTAIVASLLAVAGCVAGLGPQATGSPVSALHHFDQQGIALDYPATWSLHDQLPASSGFGSTWAIIGTLAWGPCAPSDINCHYEQRLEPGQIEVRIGILGLGTGGLCQLGATRSDLEGRSSADPVATGSLTRIAGRPAIRTDYAVNGMDYYHSDEWRIFEIAPIGTTSTAYSIDAKYRGPDIEALRAALDQLVARIRLSGSSYSDGAGPADCGAPFPAP